MEFVDNDYDDDNLWVACSNGNLDKIKQLIESRLVDVNAQDENGYSAMHASVSYGHLEVLQYLLSVGGNIRLKDNDGDEPIHYCEDPEILEYLIENGADPLVENTNGEDLFQKSIDDENTIMVNYLISRGLGRNIESIPQFEFVEGNNDDNDENDDFNYDAEESS